MNACIDAACKLLYSARRAEYRGRKRAEQLRASPHPSHHRHPSHPTADTNATAHSQTARPNTAVFHTVGDN